MLCRLCLSLCYCGMSAVTWWFLKSDLQGFWVGFPLVQWQFPPAKASMIGLMRHCCKWSKGVSWLCVLSVFISVLVPKLKDCPVIHPVIHVEMNHRAPHFLVHFSITKPWTSCTPNQGWSLGFVKMDRVCFEPHFQVGLEGCTTLGVNTPFCWKYRSKSCATWTNSLQATTVFVYLSC